MTLETCKRESSLHELGGGWKGQGQRKGWGLHLLRWGEDRDTVRAGGAKQRFKYGMSFNAVQVLEENLRE